MLTHLPRHRTAVAQAPHSACARFLALPAHSYGRPWRAAQGRLRPIVRQGVLSPRRSGTADPRAANDDEASKFKMAHDALGRDRSHVVVGPDATAGPRKSTASTRWRARAGFLPDPIGTRCGVREGKSRPRLSHGIRWRPGACGAPYRAPAPSLRAGRLCSATARSQNRLRGRNPESAP
jgi:hypothetical protein